MSFDPECNDVHSRLNRVTVSKVLKPDRTEAVIGILTENRCPVSICGARHAMGGQQFGKDTVLIDLTEMRSVGAIDSTRGLVEIGAGIKWPELIEKLHEQQVGVPDLWTIRQKQTGADDLTIGGSLAANIHGRGLKMRPIIDDVEAFTLIDADGSEWRCSRSENADLFRLAIGGYGCFGVITSVNLRLGRRQKLVRTVEIRWLDELIALFAERSANGYLFGDFQFSIDEASPDFLKRGVFSCYGILEKDVPMPESQPEFGTDGWENLIHLAHTDRAKCFDVYADYYLRTDGALYWSDTHQLSVYLDDYHAKLDKDLNADCAGTEMISELYVPRENLTEFMNRAAEELRRRQVTVIYGTIRLIEKDTESFLSWAREDFACVIFNIHTDHCPEGIERSREAFRALIDIALSLRGSFYLTYHRWATKAQLLTAYPQFPEFIRSKRKHDPENRFQSDWWRHVSGLIADC